ncbi:hypothetical protein BH23CYA1_BH23CYA1_17740 [soil metagenome]
MRKFTASFVTSLAAIFAGLTGCGQSDRVPEWSFEAPADEPGESAYVSARAEASLPTSDATEPDFEQTVISETVSKRPVLLNNVASARTPARYAPTSSQVYLPASPPFDQSQVKQTANSVASNSIPATGSPVPASPPLVDSLAARTVLAASAPPPLRVPSQADTQTERNTAAESPARSADGLPMLPPKTADAVIAQPPLSTAALEESAEASAPALMTPNPLPVVAPAKVTQPDLDMETSETEEDSIGTAILLDLQRLSGTAADPTGTTAGLTTAETVTDRALADLTRSLSLQESVLLADLQAALNPSPAAVSLQTLQQGLPETVLFDGNLAKPTPKANLYYSAGYLYSPLVAGLRTSAAPRPAIYFPAVESASIAK